MKKAVNLPVTMYTVRMCEKPLITAEVQNISKNICREKDILQTSRVSIGRYDCRSTNTSQGLIPSMKDGLPKISVTLWADTLLLVIAERISHIRKIYRKLSTEYEEEQRQVKQAIVELQTLIDNGEQNEVDLQEFLRNIRKYTDPTELTAEILNDLVDKIVIHAPDKSSGHRKQKIEIYYKAVGIINIANENCVALDGRLGMQNRKKRTA